MYSTGSHLLIICKILVMRIEKEEDGTVFALERMSVTKVKIST